MEFTMKLRVVSRVAGMIVAMFAVSFFAAGTADAGIHKTSRTKAACYKSAKAAKKTCRAYGYTAGTGTVYVRKSKVAAWHGWVVRSPAVFYWEGQAFHGGTPKGPAMWYNNGEGGFNAAAFWKIADRYSH
jgi:uncharacterized membrane protein